MKRVAVLLLALLGVAACGADPVPDAGSQAGERASPGPTPPEEPARIPRAATREAAAPEGPLRSSPSVTLGVEPREAGPASPETGLAVTLRGTAQATRRSEWELFVCGLPAYFDKEGRFVVRRSFPRVGTYVVSAVLRRASWLGSDPKANGAEEHATDCRITVTTTPEETAHVRRLSAEVIGADGEVDEEKLRQLVGTRDLRTVPALWRVIEAHPNGRSRARKSAVWAIGSLVHLDSLPRLIRLLTDWGVYEDVYGRLHVLGLWGPDIFQYKPPPSEERDVNRIIERMLDRFAEREPALRLALHQ